MRSLGTRPALLFCDNRASGSKRRLGRGRRWVHAHLDAGADHVCLQVLDPDPDGLPMAGWRALAPTLLGR